MHSYGRVVIARPPDVVFAYLSDLENDAAWNKRIMSRRTSEERREGAIYARTYGNGRLKVYAQVTVVEHEPPRRFVFTSTTSSSQARVEYLLAPATEGTEVTKNLTMTADARWIRIINELSAPFMRRADQEALEKLKQILEGLKP